MRILISGASIAGPVLAYWLARGGFDITVVERAPALRKIGGHAVDLFRPFETMARRHEPRPSATRGITVDGPHRYRDLE
jgi:2-polyprenyl-6-methoxyphenol hydroxylase-like FAD-dependent oxidoreductase